MQFEEGHTVGIDLGTTFSTIACLDDDGNPVPLENEDEDVETPSLVLLTSSGHVVVGPNRMRAAMEDPQNVVERVKRFMGDTEFKRTFDGREITPEFLSALILKKLKQDAEKRIGKIGNAVITVPYYFNDVRRKATEDAGRIAGINVVDIINEPTAATLTYAWTRGELGTSSEEDKGRKALVYDLGGGTFDVTVVHYTPTHFQVLATDGDVHLGGIDWNERLVNHVAEEFQRHHGVDPRESPATLQMLRYDCDQAKIRLSDEMETSVSCRHEGKALSVPVTRAQFEEMTADLVQRTLDTAELVLEQAKITPADLDAVVLVGGSTLLPKIKPALTKITGMEPDKGISPFTSVAQGAAIHAAILEAKYRGEHAELADRLRKTLAAVRQEEVNSHGLGIAIRSRKSGQMINHIMIPRNTRLPAKKTNTFATNKDGQSRVSIKVVEGDAPDPDACSMLGKCRITDLPENLPKGSPVEVTYSFSKSGRVSVEARETTGGKQAEIEIERQGNLTETEIDSFMELAANYQVE